jgi:type I restriction enzyme, S subunit
MEVKPGYKQTEVGVIPEEWEVDSLGCIGRVIRGSSPRPKGDRRYYGGNVPRLMVEDVTRDRKYVTPTIDFLTVEGAKLSRPCKKGTLTVVCPGTPTVVGLPSILAVDACIHDGMLGLVHLSPAVEPEYLFYRLTDLQEQLHAAATHGGTFVNLTTKGFGAFRIAVPPPPEQRAIATALSDVDGLLGGLDRLIAKKRDLKQAAMQQLLTGQTRLPGFHGEWEVKRLGNIATYFSGGTPPTGVASYYDGDIPWITSGDLNKGYITEVDGRISQAGLKNSASKMIEPDTLLIALYGATSGVTGISKIRASINQAVLAIIPHSDDTTFIYFKLRSLKEWVITTYTQGGQPNLSGDIVKSIELPMPNLPEQTAIASVLTEMDGELAVLEQRREKTRALKQAMMQELLTGRTRLVTREAAKNAKEQK